MGRIRVAAEHRPHQSDRGSRSPSERWRRPFRRKNHRSTGPSSRATVHPKDPRKARLYDAPSNQEPGSRSEWSRSSTLAGSASDRAAERSRMRRTPSPSPPVRRVPQGCPLGGPLPVHLARRRSIPFEDCSPEHPSGANAQIISQCEPCLPTAGNAIYWDFRANAFMKMD